MSVIEKINYGVTKDIEFHGVLCDPLYYPDASVVKIVDFFRKRYSDGRNCYSRLTIYD